MAISLASLKKNVAKPPRVIVHGDPGVGKTTFACSAPNPVVMQTEDGLGHLDVSAFPIATSFEDVLDILAVLYTDEHDYQTMVVDSLDWLEPLIWNKVCREHGKDSIEGFGYGRGYVEALTYWRVFFDGITALRDSRNMLIIMIAHSEVKRVEDPVLPTYDTHDLKLHKRAAALAEEFADIILYAAVQTNTVTEDLGFGNKRIRATTTGNRIMHTIGQPAFLAKNRYALPSPMPLTWAALAPLLEPLSATTAAP